MTIGIYTITHVASGKRYIGKSRNIEQRWYTHKWALQKVPMPPKLVNRHLWNAVQKHGMAAFRHEIIESFEQIDEAQLADRELYWMDQFDTCNRASGYNLRRDSSTSTIFHEETRQRQKVTMRGPGNPNWGNFWSDDQKRRMAESLRQRRAAGRYSTPEARRNISAAMSRIWADPDKRKAMGRKVARSKQGYCFLQFARSGRLVRIWPSVQAIVEANPGFKWQNIYNVCHFHKPTYHGFIWRQLPKSVFLPVELLI